MEQRSLYPSVFMKIKRQPHQFVRNFPIPHLSTPEGQCGAFAYVKGLNPACQGSASSSITPIMSPGFLEVPSEKGNDDFIIEMGLLNRMATAPIERLKLLIQCQNEIIIGRFSHPYKGIGNCFLRTLRNEGVTSFWRGNTIHILEFLSFKALNTAAESYLERPLKHKPEQGDYLKRFVAAFSLSVGASLYFLYPLRYAHTRLATDTINSTSATVSKRKFNGLIDVFRKTIRIDGIVGLYRGCHVSYVKILLNDALLLGISVQTIPQLLKLLGLQYDSSWHTPVLIYGIQTFVQLVTYPLDTLHCRMMMRSGEAIKYRSSLNAFSQILKTEGVRSLYKGASVQVLKNTIILGLLLASVSLFRAKPPAGKSKPGDENGEGSSSLFSTVIWKKG